MKSQEIWEESNRYCANVLIAIYSIALLSALLSQYILTYTKGIKYSGIFSIIGLLASIPITEIHLWKNFDKEGKRKSQSSTLK